MRWVWGLAALAVSAAAARADDQPHYGPIPAWVERLPIPPSTAGGHPLAFQILLWNQQTRLEADGRDKFIEVAYRVGTAEGLGVAGNVIQTWNPATERLTVNHVRILRAGREIDALANGRRLTVLRRESNLEAAMIDGVRTATLQLEGVQVGDVIDVAATLHAADPQLKGRSEDAFGLGMRGLVGRIYLKASWPAARALRWRTSSDMGAPSLVQTGGRTTLIYDLKDSVMPPLADGAPARYAVRRLVEVSGFKDWGEVSGLMEPLYRAAAQIRPGSPLQAEAARIAALSPDRTVRTLAALRLVQDQVRYVYSGLDSGGYTPVAAEDVWSRRSGDCKGKTVLLIALLQALGVEAQPALVSVAGGDGLEARLPRLGAFDHVVTRVRIDGASHWLDGTRIGDRGLDDARSRDLHWALPVQAAGAALEPLGPLPLPAPTDEKTISFDASKGFEPPVAVHAEQLYRGDAAVQSNAVLTALSREDQDRASRKFWTDDRVWLEVKKTAFAFDDAKRTLRLTMDGVGLPPWYKGTGVRDLTLNDTSLGWSADFKREPGPDHDAPYAVAHPAWSKSIVTVILPDGGRGASLYDATDINETVAGVAYHRASRLEAGRLTVEGSSRSVASEFPAASAPAAQKELRQLADFDVGLRYRTTSDPTPAAPERVESEAASMTGKPQTAAEYAARGADRLGRKDYDGAVADLTTAMVLDPKDAAFVYNRGIAHYRARQDALALIDFEAALKLDPGSSMAKAARDKLRGGRPTR